MAAMRSGDPHSTFDATGTEPGLTSMLDPFISIILLWSPDAGENGPPQRHFPLECANHVISPVVKLQLKESTPYPRGIRLSNSRWSRSGTGGPTHEFTALVHEYSTLLGAERRAAERKALVRFPEEVQQA